MGSKPTCTVCSKLVGYDILGLSEEYLDRVDDFLVLRFFFFLSASSGSFGSGLSTVIVLTNSVPRFEVSRTGGAGGFSSSDDIFAGM